METILAAFVVFIVFLFIWIAFHKKRETDGEDVPEHVDSFTCDECGERHCNCYKDDDRDSDETE